MIGRLWRWLVSTGFRLLYNELAWTYDAVSWLVSRGEWRKWQMSALPFVDGACVLEIAHGPGHMLLALAKSGRNVTGLDTSRQMGRIAARRLRHAGEPVALVRGVAQSLPFQDHAFDTVYCSFPTSFIADRRTLEAVHRVLRANGRLVIVPEGHLTGNSIVDRFIGWLYRITGQRDEFFAVGDDEYWPADASPCHDFREAMRQIGFEITAHRLKLARSAATVIVATREAN